MAALAIAAPMASRGGIKSRSKMIFVMAKTIPLLSRNVNFSLANNSETPPLAIEPAADEIKIIFKGSAAGKKASPYTNSMIGFAKIIPPIAIGKEKIIRYLVDSV